MRKGTAFSFLTAGFTLSWLSCAGGVSRDARVPAHLSNATTAEPSIHVVLPGSAAHAGSTIQLGSFDGRSFAFVSDADDKRIRAIDMEHLEESHAIDLGGTPAEMVIEETGAIAVALRDTNELAIVENGRVTKRVPVPTEPLGLAITPDHQTILVVSGWAHTLVGIDAYTLERKWTLEVAREPRKIVLGGWRGWISHAVGDVMEQVDVDRGTALPIVLEGWRESFGEGAFVGQSTAKGGQGYALAVTNDVHPTVYAPRILARTDPSFFGWEGEEEGGGGDSYGGSDAFTPESLDVARIDSDTAAADLESLVLRAGFDDTRCSLPRAALVQGERLFIACLGTDSVVELDAAFPTPHHAEVRRTKVPTGPVGMALDEAHESLVVWSQIARQISLVPLDRKEDTATSLPAVTLAPSTTRDPILLKGKMLFHASADDRISGDGRACASCHPDGREDGLVWQTNEGPRQTPMLAGRLEGTAPYGWRGMSYSVEHHLKTKSIKRLGGKGLPDDDIAALFAYVKSIELPVDTSSMPDPFVVSKGEAIFNSERTQCASCHGSDGRTPDGLDHNVRSWARGDQLGMFDTPSLRGLAQTAPYFHDGRYTSIHQLLVSVDGTMGHTKQLAPDEMNALEAYLRTR